MRLPCFGRKRTDAVRIIVANDPPSNASYPTNRITNTKYSIISFIPLNLLEQFGRFMNLYFLLIACLQLWNTITPVNPAATWVPLAVIFAISALKEGIDDYNRHLSDKRANERRYTLLKGTNRSEIQAQEIRVGDIIMLTTDSEMPCDLVLLSSSDATGSCYIETANIDGETDYKARLAPDSTMNMKPEDFANFQGIIECASPNAEIYKFNSRMKMTAESDWIALTERNLLLQATNLRVTSWIIGVAVYTGNESKVGQNKTDPPTKWTRGDRFINRSTILIFILQLALVIVFGIVGNIWQHQYAGQMWYIDFKIVIWYEWIVIPLRFLLLNSMMIPISLKVSLDIVKYLYAKFIDWDVEMYDEETDTPAKATSTALSEDLGQIEYVFSDKTGTLTENKMEFVKCCIDGVLYGHALGVKNAYDDGDLAASIRSRDEHVHNFFRALALCHSVNASRSEEKLVYKASSPDEEALVKAAAHFGFIFTGGDSRQATVDIHETEEKYQRLHVFEFNSDRKRMSVLFREPSGKLLLITKGADDMIFARLRDDEDISRTKEQLEMLAQIGLRTLVIGSRIVDEEEYNNWLPTFHAANTSLDDRERLLAESYEGLEHSLLLLGASAIEDKLQEGVPEAIADFREAGLRIWMLTGDKYSTAIQIGQTCNLISHAKDALIPLDGNSKVEMHTLLNSTLNRITRTKAHPEFSLIIEGKFLNFALECQELFLELSLRAQSVICCRVTPQQKAQVVAMVKNSGHVTLSIGDGGNDVGMIQEAHVGVGIAGREGLQAARASDYAIGKFRFLKRLMFVHGRYSFIRTSFVAQYCFYKSLFLCWMQMMYQVFAGFSGTAFFTTFNLTTYNLLFTSLPILLYVLDKDYHQDILMKNPKLYKDTQSGKYMTRATMIHWILRSVYQAIVIFIFTMAIFYEEVYRTGRTLDYDGISMVAYTAVILVNACTIISESNNMTLVNHGGIALTLVAYFIILGILNNFPNMALFGETQRLFADVNYWFAVLISTVAAMLPFWAYNYIHDQYLIPHIVLSNSNDDARRSSSMVSLADDANTPLLRMSKSNV